MGKEWEFEGVMSSVESVEKMMGKVKPRQTHTSFGVYRFWPAPGLRIAREAERPRSELSVSLELLPDVPAGLLAVTNPRFKGHDVITSGSQ